MKRELPYKILEDKSGYRFFILGIPFTAAIPKELIDGGHVTMEYGTILFDYSQKNPVLAKDYFSESQDKEVVLYQCCAMITFNYDIMEHLRGQALLKDVLFYERVKPLNERSLSNFFWRTLFDFNYRIAPQHEVFICQDESEIETCLDLRQYPMGEMMKGVIKADLDKIGFWDLLTKILGPDNVYKCSPRDLAVFNLIQYSKEYAIGNSIQAV